MVGTNVYGDGNFVMAGGGSATNVARWNGTAWSGLGSGASTLGSVSALAWWNNSLYVSGGFQRAGQKPAYRICRWDDQTTFVPPTVMQLLSPVFLPNGRMEFRLGVSGGAACVLEGSSDLSTWTPLFTNTAAAFDYTNAPPAGVAQQFYRTRQVP